jgi:hypothetical protein
MMMRRDSYTMTLSYNLPCQGHATALDCVHENRLLSSKCAKMSLGKLLGLCFQFWRISSMALAAYLNTVSIKHR